MTDLRLGVIARGENRGLGIQTWEVCRHLDPELVLLIDMGELSGHFERIDRFSEHWPTHLIPIDDMADRRIIASKIADLDVVYFAETPYRWEFCEIAHNRGVGTVCHLNPEFFGHWKDIYDPTPTQWWLPSTWMRHDTRIAQFDPRYMPMPCPLDRWPEPVASTYDGSRPLRLLHVSGHAAMGDRNGTRAMFAALKHVTTQVEVTVTTQDRHLPSPGRLPGNVKYKHTAGRADYWRLYEDFDLLIMPRRYGGLCLPVIEAAGAGLGIIMTDCEPNGDYPALRIPATRGADLPGKFGAIPTHTINANELAAVIDNLARDPAAVAVMQGLSRSWAADMAWDQWAEPWKNALSWVRP